MAKKKRNTEEKVAKKASVSRLNGKKDKTKRFEKDCEDKLCPFHGEKSKKLKIRGRVFEGEVIKKFRGRVVIQFERMFKVRKYERYERRTTKIHARLPGCLEEQINIGDIVKVGETRPISKMIHAVVFRKIRSKFSDRGEKK